MDGDKVWTRKTFQGTHLGPFMGLPPSGKPFSFEAIVEHWAVSDTLGLMQQIGAFPSPDRGGR